MKVYVNYNVLNSNGQEYSSYNEELQGIIDRLKIRSESLKEKWNSPSGNNYISQLDSFIEDLQVDANKMKRHSNIILGVKDQFQETDLEYKKHFTPEIIERNDYGEN